MTESIVTRAALLLWLLLACTFSVQAQQASNEPYPRLVVNGQGSAEIPPDMAILQLMVTREADTAGEALDANSAAMSDVLQALRDEDIAERDLQTSNFSIQPRYNQRATRSDGERELPRIIGYTVRNGLTVRVRNLATLGAIIDKSVTLGVNQGGSIQFTNDDPSAAISEARTNAVKDAMAKAQTLASAAGVGLGKVLEISEHSFNPSPRPVMQAEMMRAAVADAVPVAAGENSYQVTVNLSYAIEQ